MRVELNIFFSEQGFFGGRGKKVKKKNPGVPDFVEGGTGKGKWIRRN